MSNLFFCLNQKREWRRGPELIPLAGVQIAGFPGSAGPRQSAPTGDQEMVRIAYKTLCFPSFGRFEWVLQLTTNRENAYKTWCFLTFRGLSGGAVNAKRHPNAYKTCRFFNILDFLGVTEMGPRDRSVGLARAVRGGIT